MIQSRLRIELEKVARRRRRLWVLGTLACIWLLAAAIGLAILWLLRNSSLSPWTAAWLAGGAVLAAVASGVLALRSARDERSIARMIEARHPGLQSRLVTAIEQQPDQSSGRFGYLQETVIREALEHARRHPWIDAISDGRLLTVRIGHFFSLALFGSVLIAMLALAVSRPNLVASNSDSPDAVLTTVGRYRVEIKPGDVELERGTSLVVMARFDGELPPDAELSLESASGKNERIAMSRSLDDPLFGARVPSIDEDLTYRVAFDGQQTDPFRVTVFEYPALVQADARLKFPDYTSMEEKLVEDTRRVSAVEGTQLTWVCRLNKPVAEARLESGGESIALVPDPADAKLYTATITLVESRRYRLHLKDEHGRANKEPPEFVVNVLPNQPPKIEIAWPSRDAQVSPLEEFDVEATAWDDFGLARYGLVYAHAGGEEQEIVVGEASSPKEKRAIEHQIDLEQLGAEPDDLLSYYFFAEDRGPDGQIRRTASDMFFAEVRRYEEVFRQGEQPPGGQQQQQQQQQAGQNAQQAEQLAELQKQIIAATWNLIRRERPDHLTPQFTPDARLLVESQTAAMEQLEELAGNVQDPESQGHVEEVKNRMVAATKQLMRAVDETSPEPLRKALPEEQAAYQGLLKLRAREYQVMRSNSRQQQQQSSSSSGASSAMQRQLDQLELKDDENRYETQRTAQDQQENQQQREVRQALNRLKELARRQEDLNKQLQELQSALEQAKTEEEKEEIRRRLQRLRDEEQQMLRDLDELRERMDEPQNQPEMADSQERLAESRENVRQASEALEQGRVSQALAEGTRAQRQFEELRDEFRRKAAGQFDEEMREMREAARELDEKERELADRMQPNNDPGERRSLRDPGEKQNLAEGFQDQKERLNDLLNQMEQVVREAEQPEPLLADQLYDAVRTARQRQIENALDTARQLAQAGLTDQAAPAEEAARAGIENLRQGVERAAQSVLGDETEALERAQQTLDDLARQLEREAQARGQESGIRSQDQREAAELAPHSGAENPRSEDSQVRQAAFDAPNQGQNRTGQDQRDQEQNPQGRSQEGENQQGQNQRGQNQEGQNQDGQPQEGENQQGQNQQGQNQQGQNQQGQNQDGQNQQSQSAQGRGQRDPRSLRGGARNSQLDDVGGARPFDHQGAPMNPLTGENFREWSDQLRDVEEMLEDPELRAEAAEIRDRAREMRIEYKRHSQEPNWGLVRMGVIKPLNDLRDRVAEELIRRQAGEVLAPIDRDPVPPQFAEPVRRYYEELGRGRE